MKRKSARARLIEQVQAEPVKIVKHIRSVLHLSQEALARICGVAVPTVSRWECGRMKPRHALAVLTLVRLARQTGYKLPEPEPKNLSPIPRERRRQLAERELSQDSKQ